jgi:DNA polymerase
MLEKTPDTDLAAVEHFIFIDTELFATVSITDVDNLQYARHPKTELLVVAFAIDDGAVETWKIGDPIPPAIEAAADDPAWKFVAHNAPFDATIWNEHLVGHGWPATPIDRWICTSATAAALAFPHKLETLAEALGLEQRKDKAGAKLMRLMTRPQTKKPTKGKRKAEKPPTDRREDPANLLRLSEYCAQDLRACRAAFYALPALAETEVELWHIDRVINARGLPFDRTLVEACRDVAVEAKPLIDAELAQLTAGAVTTVGQVERLKNWLKGQGLRVTTLEKKAIVKLLLSDLNPVARRVIELRQQGAKNTVAKFGKMLTALDDDDRARDLLFYHAASTGRWSSKRVQIHNLARTALKDPEAAIAAVISRNLERIAALGPPLVVLTNLARATICAPAGHCLMGADFSAIEARVLAWLVGETRKLKAFIEFDRTGDPHLEPYLITAALIFGVAPGSYATDAPQRAIGKTGDLAFGYGGGVDAWRNFEPDPAHPASEETINKFKSRWRRAHPNVERFWYAIANSAIAAVHDRGQAIRCGRILLKHLDEHLYLKLPSGRLLCYPHARVEISKNRRKYVVFMDNGKGGCREERLWYGTLTENVVSGIARDLLCAAIVRVEASGLQTIFHVHDEIVVELDTPEATPEQLAQFKALMTVKPDWAFDLPIAAKTWSARRYVK